MTPPCTIRLHDGLRIAADRLLRTLRIPRRVRFTFSEVNFRAQVNGGTLPERGEYDGRAAYDMLGFLGGGMERFSSIQANAKVRGSAFMLGYALYLAFGYTLFHPTTLFSAASGHIGAQTEFWFLIAIVVTRIAAYAVTAVLAALRNQLRLAVSVAISCLSGAAGFLVVCMLVQFSDFAPDATLLPWMLAAGAFFGVGDAIANLLWARFSSTLTLRSVYLFALLSNLASLAVYLLLVLLPAALVLPVTAALFIAAVLFAKPCIEAQPEQADEYSTPVFKSAVASLWRPVLGTAILSFLSALMLQMPAQREIPLATFQMTSLITQPVVIVALLVPALFIKKQPELGSVYKVALPLSAAGFLLLPLIWNDAGGLANACAQLGTLVANIILWCMLADTVRDTKLPSALVFSLALLAVNASRLAGTLVAVANAETLARGDIALTTVALVAVYLVAMISLFLLKEKKQPRPAHDTPTSAEPLDVLALKCESLSDRKRFTPREREIVVHLAQGRTVHAISEKLFVSENTVKSHIKSIYLKLDIHSRAELIETISAEGE